MGDQTKVVDESNDERLRFALYVEGKRVATSTASAAVAQSIQTSFGVTDKQVREELRHSLDRLQQNQLDKVTIEHLHETPPDSLRFEAVYLYRDSYEITEGLVWYDLNQGETGPEDLPALVRNKIRYVVHERLTQDSEAARRIRNVLRP